MSTFTTPLIVKIIKGKRKFEVYVPFKYHVGKYPSDEILTVPIGFKTDLASIPRLIWPIVAPTDEYAKAAVLHDWMYFKGMYSRKESDRIFNEAMKVLETPKWKRLLVYFFVRTCSWWSWRKHRKRNET
jgi:hypothetical protein